MSAIGSIAARFHEACMTGKGWQECQRYCTPDAAFSHEGDMFADIHTLEGYAGFMQGVFGPVPDFRHQVLSVALDEEHQRVLVHYLISGTHTGEGLPVPPTGKSMTSNCVLVLQFEGDRIRHATKVWNDHHTSRQVGWV